MYDGKQYIISQQASRGYLLPLLSDSFILMISSLALLNSLSSVSVNHLRPSISISLRHSLRFSHCTRVVSLFRCDLASLI